MPPTTPRKRVPTKLSKRLIDALSPDPGDDFFVWDAALPGFGVRVTEHDGIARRAYVIAYRPKGSRRVRRLTLGSHGALTLEQARELAKGHQASVAQGADPQELLRSARGERTFARSASPTSRAWHSRRRPRPRGSMRASGK